MGMLITCSIEQQWFGWARARSMSRNILVILQHGYRYVACSSDWLVVDTGTVVVDDTAAVVDAAVP